MDGIKSGCVSGRENGSRCRVEFCTRVTSEDKKGGTRTSSRKFLFSPRKKFREGTRIIFTLDFVIFD